MSRRRMGAAEAGPPHEFAVCTAVNRTEGAPLHLSSFGVLLNERTWLQARFAYEVRDGRIVDRQLLPCEPSPGRFHWWVWRFERHAAKAREDGVFLDVSCRGGLTRDEAIEAAVSILAGVAVRDPAAQFRALAALADACASGVSPAAMGAAGPGPDPETVKRLVKEYLEEHDLAFDATIHTREEWRTRGEKYGNDAVVTIATEGPLGRLLNYGDWPGAAEEVEAFNRFLENLRLYWDLGYAWSVHLYPLPEEGP